MLISINTLYNLFISIADKVLELHKLDIAGNITSTLQYSGDTAVKLLAIGDYRPIAAIMIADLS